MTEAEELLTPTCLRCIFCKRASEDNRSVEHIIPESLGNSAHVLPSGIVCDQCNQYFARKVERQILESAMFMHLRSGMEVPSKRGRIPAWRPSDGIQRPSYRQMGRLLCKIGIEVLAFKTLAVSESNNEIVNKTVFDEIRQFARFNQGSDWPFTTRTLHPINAVFVDCGERFELLNEFDILLIDNTEVFAVISLFGVEFVLNLCSRNLDGYRIWLETNHFASPLYVAKNAAT